MFFHGTSDALVDQDTAMLLPGARTRVTRTANPHRVVFLTDDRAIAEGHAQKTAERFGGKAIIVIAIPEGSADLRGNATFVTNAATIERIEYLN